jgi:sulfonate transport system permease protein
MSLPTALPIGNIRPASAPSRLRGGVSSWLQRSAVFLTILLVWHLASRSGIVSPFPLPSPARVFTTGFALTRDGSLPIHFVISLARALSGFFVAVLIALPTAVLFATAPSLRRLLEPPLEFIRQIPPLALIPLLILWLGIGEAQKLGVVALTCFFPAFLGTLDGLVRVDPRLIEVGRVCGFGRSVIIRRIVLPAAMPSIVTGLRIALGFSWRALVGAELIAASAGLGYMIVDAQNLARTDIVLVGVVVIGVLGICVDVTVRALIHRLMPWMRLNGHSPRA